MRVLLFAILLAGCGASSTPAPSPAPAPGGPGAAPDAESPEPTTPGRGPAVTYHPVRDAAYRLERHDSLDLQYPGGATQEQVRDRVAFLHVSVVESPTPGQFQVSVVLDSLQALENGQPAAPDSLFADELTGRLRLLFPALPAGGVREGMEWTDTTEYKLTADAFPGTERAVTTYRAAAAERTGSKVLTLESAGRYDRTGTRQQGEQELQMAAKGSRHGTHLFGMDGVLVDARGNDAGDMTITVPSLGQTVPVKQSGSYSVVLTTPQ